MKYAQYYLLSISVILLDQLIKLWVHNNMELHTEIPVFGDWFKIHYILNNGMAFGMRLDWEYGKLLLTSFRLLAMVGIGYYLYYLAKTKVHPGLLWSIALILGGAIGNVIDSTLYGVLLDNASPESITPWFHGKVVDMFYLDIWNGVVAEWVPIWGGKMMHLWPIFNLADASIFVGVALILIMQKKFFASKQVEEMVEADQGSLESKLPI